MRRMILVLWCVAVGAQAGTDLTGLSQAAEYSASRGETALLVWQNGRTVYQRARRPGVPQRIFSMTKSLVSIGVFRDAKTGGLSLGQPARHRAAQGVALSDLLNQISGLPAAAREFYSQGLKDKEPVLSRLRARGNSGAFVYGPSHWEVLAEEIGAQRGPSLDRWVRRFVPGARPEALARWTRDDKGCLFFSTGARMDANDLLPAGREVLDGVQRGKWPPEVRAMLAQGTKANRMYALGFWLNRGASGPVARDRRRRFARSRPVCGILEQRVSELRSTIRLAGHDRHAGSADVYRAFAQLGGYPSGGRTRIFRRGVFAAPFRRVMLNSRQEVSATPAARAGRCRVEGR